MEIYKVTTSFKDFKVGSFIRVNEFEDNSKGSTRLKWTVYTHAETMDELRSWGEGNVVTITIHELNAYCEEI